MSKRIVRVQLSDGEVVAVRGKMADLIAWVCRNKEKVEAIHQGELSFNWSEGESGQAGSFRPAFRATMPSEKFSQ